MSRQECEHYLRPGEELFGPDDWSLSPDSPVFVVSVGYPEVGQARNQFVDGWGPSPDEAWQALKWKLVDRSLSGRLTWPNGPDKSPLWPSAEEIEKQRIHYERSMSPMGYAYAKAFLWDRDLSKTSA